MLENLDKRTRELLLSSNPENGNPRWLGFAFDGTSNGGHFPMTRTSVKCLQTVTDLAYIYVCSKIIDEQDKVLGLD